MVFFFTTEVDGREYELYMGRDKMENEDLLKYAFPEDVWFHVDKLSSAHVYLRLKVGEKVDDIPKQLVEECCQLVKANSIAGCKLNNVDIVYTPYPNLKKTADMVDGQVGFHKNKKVVKINIEKKNEVWKKLEKTREEREVDLRALREERDRLEREEIKKKQKIERDMEKLRIEQERKDKEMRSYSLMDTTNTTSNHFDNESDAERELVDDFMWDEWIAKGCDWLLEIMD